MCLPSYSWPHTLTVNATQFRAPILPFGWCFCHRTAMHCLFDRKLNSSISTFAPHHASIVSHWIGGLFFCVFWLSLLGVDYFATWVHSSIPSSSSSPWSFCLFLFPPQRLIHPSEHPVLSIPFIGMIVIVAVVWCWLSELASQRARYGRSLSLHNSNYTQQISSPKCRKNGIYLQVPDFVYIYFSVQNQQFSQALKRLQRHYFHK